MKPTLQKGEGDKTSMTFRQLIVLVVISALFVSQAGYGLEDGRIGVLYIGCIARSPPFWFLGKSPLFSINFVQATLRDWAAWGPIQKVSEGAAQRMVRLYMPRTYNHLVERFDIIALANANRFAVGPQNVEMLAMGVSEGGMGLFMSGGWETLSGSFGPPWGETSIGKLLPTTDLNTFGGYIRDGRLIIDEDGNEFISSLPWDTRPDFMRAFWHNPVSAKSGADVLAHVDGLCFRDHPGMVTWKLANGPRTFVFTGEIHRACMTQRVGGYWDYCIDLGSNLMIYLDGRPVPQDVELVHRVRSKVFEISTRKSLLLTLVEFCESFGANADAIVAMVDDVDHVVAEATPQYLELRFEDVWETYLEADRMLKESEEAAIKIKNRALLWVYLIEWLAVTGTGMLCGFVLWTIMIKRRFYREVQTSRLNLI